MNTRISKINSLLASDLSQIIARVVDLKPDAFLTVTKVETASDLHTSKIYVQSFPSSAEDYIMKTLAHEHSKIQKELAQHLTIKKTPQLIFLPDHHGQSADHLKTLLSES